MPDNERRLITAMELSPYSLLPIRYSLHLSQCPSIDVIF